MPLVSVVIPAYNSAHYLGDAIESVLRQTVRDVEIVVVDDGSTDNTSAVMEKYDLPSVRPSVRYIHQKNTGVSSARNCGLQACSGKYVGFLDADDLWLPQKLEKQLSVLKEERACYTAYTKVKSDLTPVVVVKGDACHCSIEQLITSGNLIGSGTILAERRIFDVVGGFDPSLSQCADWDMWIRIASQTDIAYLDEALVLYRLHETNMSRNPTLLESDSIAVLEKVFSNPAMIPEGKRIRRSAFARNYSVLAGTYFHAGNVKDSLRCATRAVSMDVRQAIYLMGFSLRVLARGSVRRRAA